MRRTLTILLVVLTVVVLSLAITLTALATILDDPYLSIETQPGDSAPGQAITGPPTVRAYDENGNNASNVIITVSEIGHGYTLDSGTLTQTTNGDGIATFDDLVISTVAEDYRLQFTASGYDTTTSSYFDVQTPTEVWVDDGWAGTDYGIEVETGKYFGYNAFAVIQDGINAVSGSTVHVAAGTYYENVTLRDGVSVYGAGAGSCIIDGSSSGTVVYADGITSDTTFDGFTLQNGSGYYDIYHYGGGMYIKDSSSSLTVSNCTFTTNTANYGGGLYNTNSNPTVTGCTFTSNSAVEYGGGMYNTNSNPTVTDCIFTSNLASNWGGGGMCNLYSSSPTVTGCTFTSNSAGYLGGGMCNYSSSSPALTDCTFTSNTADCGGGMGNYTNSSPTVTGCTFTDNTANYGGGMYNYSSSNPTVTNCTFSTNSADTGGGMYSYASSSPAVTNCIFWGDTPDEIVDNSATPTVIYCDVEGGYANGTDIIDSDPLFEDAANGDFHLTATSPCIDAGNNSAASIPDYDYEGDGRIFDGDGDGTATVDMGVDEYLPPPDEVWVDNSWASQTDVDTYDSSLTWQYNAFAVIQDGIDNVASPGTVHVLAGTYTENITLTNGVDVLGVGAGDNPAVNSIIDGNTSGTVVYASAITSDTTFDGFTLRNGSSTYGGGMYTAECTSSLTVSNCTFTSNTATNTGGGMYNYNSSPTVSDCIFTSNSATNYGGGICNWEGCSPVVTGCVFTSNLATNGGGMENYQSSPVVTNCIFYDNTARDWGGGMVNTSSSSPVVTNCTFYHNKADDAEISNFSSSNPKVTNCILWNGNCPDEIADSSSTSTVSYCVIEGGYVDGTDIIDSDPLFVNADNGDFHLQETSPCIDAGNNSATSIPTYDYEGDDRIMDGDDDGIATVDMGVDEYPEPPDEVWVDDDWEDQDDVETYDSSLTWQYDAFAVIQDGIDNVASTGTVHVLAGTYTENITLKDGVSVYGAGAGSSIIDGSGTSDMTVVYAEDITSDTTFDGFTLRNGSGYYDYYHYGGGMYIKDSSSALTVSNCTFTSNSAQYGGGVYNDNSDTTLTGCTLFDNSATCGGGMGNGSSDPTLTDCTFSSNTASSNGGGMYNYESSSPTVLNCTFTGNEASYGGGMFNLTSSPVVTNCTFYTNSVDNNGGGMYNYTSSSPEVTNCIFWGDSPDEIVDNSATPTVSYCDIQGDDSGGTILNSDPLFENAASGDFHLTSTSPCIDAGDDSAATNAGLTTDFDGESRFMDGDDNGTATVDMGVDEYPEPPAEVWVDDSWAGLNEGDDVDSHTFGMDAFDTVTEGVNTVAYGGTVHVAEGTYNENVDIAKSLTLEGADKDTTIINGGGDGSVVTITAGSVNLSGFTITNSGDIPIEDCGVFLDGVSGCTIEDCIVNNNGGIGIGLQLADGNTIQDNTLNNNSIAAIGLMGSNNNYVLSNSCTNTVQYYGSYGHGIAVQSIDTENDEIVEYVSKENTVDGNTCNSNEGDGIYLGQECDENQIINNTLTDNGNNGLYAWKSGTNIIAGNTIGSNTASGIELMASQNNDIWGNDITGSDIGIWIRSGNINYGSGWVVLISTGNSIEPNDIYGNTSYGIKYDQNDYANDDDILIDADNNWWGDTSGPYHATTNPTGTGNAVSDYIDYDPWLEVTVENALAGAVTDGTLDNTADAATEVVVTGSATVASAGYSDDPSGTGFTGDIGKYIDIHIDDASGVTNLEIRLYYTDDEITGLDESSLVLYWWDGATWAECDNSGVNTDDVGEYSGYIWAYIDDGTTPSLADLTGTVFGGYGTEPVTYTTTTVGGDHTAPNISNVNDCDLDVTATTADICWTTNEPATSKVKYWADDDDTLTAFDGSYVNTHHVQLTGLTPGTTYSYRLISRDMADNTATSEVYEFTTAEGEAATTETADEEDTGDDSAATSSSSTTAADDEADVEEVLIDDEPTDDWPWIVGIVGGVIVIGLVTFFLARKIRGY